MAEKTLRRQYITDADGTPIGVILPMDEFALVRDILEQRFPHESETDQRSRASLKDRSIKDADLFGMWADRKDLAGRSSREWLEDVRAQQWPR
jgi:hypothetical protein